LGFVALKECRYDDAKRFFMAGIQSAEEFGRVDELAKGQLGLASVYFETDTDLKTTLSLVNESIDSFQQQGMQFEIHKAKVLQEDILKAHPQILTSQ
jgi:hypothetical protein